MALSETELSDRLLPTIAALGRMRVGRAWIRRHKNKYFQIDFGRVCRKRLRLHRKTATEAIRVAVQRTQELKQHGQFAASLSTAQRFEATACYAKLDKIGATLTEAVEAFVKKHPLGGNGRTLPDAIAELVRKKRAGNRRERYVADLDWKLRAFAAAFPGRSVAAITTEDLEDWIARHPKWGPVTQRSYVQAYNVLFNYAVKRGFRADNPCEKLELPTLDKKEPVIFTVDQMRQALVHAHHGPAELRPCIPWLALGGFAGIRPEEIEKLDWQHVDFENRTITVLGIHAKTRSRRVVDMAANLFAWLQPIAREAGAVLTESLHILRSRMRLALGLARWPSDVLRHSFGSYYFAEHKSLVDTVNQMGHTDGGRMFFNHYRALVTPREAHLWWRIIPTELLHA
jgi:integrase